MGDTKPNIVMLVNDHQAYYGHKGIKRPAFDALAASGTQFNRAYCTSPLCCPSRKSMLTGLYPHNSGQLENSYHTPVNNHQTYIDVLAKAGYAQYYVGKWHASQDGPFDLGCQGFSCNDYGNPYLTPEYKAYIKKYGLPAASMRVEKNMWKHSLLPNINEGDLYDFPQKMANEALSGILECPKESHEAFFLADMAGDRLEALAGQDKPFMLRLDFWGPHQPYHPTREFADMYPPATIVPPANFADDLSGKPHSYRFEYSAGIQDNNELITPNPMPLEDWQLLLSRCYGQISLIDEAGGRVLQKLHELGLGDNTLVLWTADHGDALACHGGHFDKGTYMPEEVMRIPLALSWPGHIPQGSISDALICNTDYAPTLAEAAGQQFDQPVDGRSILPLFDAPDQWRQSLMCETHGHINPWLARMVVEDRYTYICNQGDMEELYDLLTDPGELKNLALQNKNDPMLPHMREVLARWCAKTHDAVFLKVLAEAHTGMNS